MDGAGSACDRAGGADVAAAGAVGGPAGTTRPHRRRHRSGRGIAGSRGPARHAGNAPSEPELGALPAPTVDGAAGAGDDAARVTGNPLGPETQAKEIAP